MACADWRAVARAAAAACDARAIESAALGSFARLYCADFCADSAVAAPSEEMPAGDDGEEATSGDLASVDPVRAARLRGASAAEQGRSAPQFRIRVAPRSAGRAAAALAGAGRRVPCGVACSGRSAPPRMPACSAGGLPLLAGLSR
jgi:hypothetical protein